MAIISMAQQARPKSRGHQEKLRPKPRSFSRLAGTAIPGMCVIDLAGDGGIAAESVGDRGSVPLRARNRVGHPSRQRHAGETHRVAHSHSSTPFFHA